MSDALNHAELSRDLALAIGWQVVINGVTDYEMNSVGSVCLVTDPQRGGYERKDFDYRDPTVCLPLFKWLIVEHDAHAYRWGRGYVVEAGEAFAECETPEEAVARVVIAVKGKP